jgi:hypothetical protein
MADSKRRLPEIFERGDRTNSDSDDGKRKPKRRRSTRRKVAESKAKIAETARREAEVGSDDGEDGEDGGGRQQQQQTRRPIEAEAPKIKKRLRDVPTMEPMENPPHDLIVRLHPWPP